MTIGHRLRVERNRLGLNQTDFAGLAGTTKKTQIDYEKDVSSPAGKYLAAIAEAGADVQYIVSGVRSVNLNMVSEGRAEYGQDRAETADELTVLNLYRKLSAKDRKLARELLERIDTTKA